MSTAARDRPAVTVVVCTRNRGDRIRETMTTLLANDYPDMTVVVVDQSDDDVTLRALASFLDDPRVSYRHMDERGVSRSRSSSLRDATTEFVLSTDDDCAVGPTWVHDNVRALLAHPRAALVFGDVVSIATEPGYTPVNIADADVVVSSLWSWPAPDGVNVGIGASVAMRRSLVLAVGAFDNALGPGSVLGNAEDTDLTLRCVLAGHQVVHTTSVEVVHHGHRSLEEFRRLNRVTMLAVGAVASKALRRRPAAGAWWLGGVTWRTIVVPAAVALRHGRKPPVLGRATYLARGVWRGLRMPLERGPSMRFADQT